MLAAQTLWPSLNLSSFVPSSCVCFDPITTLLLLLQSQTTTNDNINDDDDDQRAVRNGNTMSCDLGAQSGKKERKNKVNSFYEAAQS